MNRRVPSLEKASSDPMEGLRVRGCHGNTNQAQEQEQCGDAATKFARGEKNPPQRVFFRAGERRDAT